MYNLTNFPNPEGRQVNWKNSYEIQIAALEHEKRRHQMLNAETSLALPRPQMIRARKSSFISLLQVTLQALASMFG